jgi:hypothetical protein
MKTSVTPLAGGLSVLSSDIETGGLPNVFLSPQKHD